MSTTAKVLVGLHFVLSVVFLAMTSSSFWIRNNWHAKYDELFKQYNDAIGKWNSQREQQNAQIAALRTLNGNLAMTNTSQTTQLEQVNSDKTNLEQQLATQTNQATTAMQMAQQKEQTIKGKDDQIASLTNEKTELLSKLDAAEGQKLEYQAQVNELQNKFNNEVTKNKQLQLDNQKYIAQYQEAEENLNILKGKGIDVEELVKGVAPLVNGRVLAVDPELNLVMVSVGADDNVKPGYHFYAHRNGEYIGEIIIDKIDSDAAFGRVVLSGTRPGMMVEVGDNVTTQLGS